MMATKHNTEINNEPLKREYFDDVLELFYDINEKKCRSCIKRMKSQASN